MKDELNAREGLPAILVKEAELSMPSMDMPPRFSFASPPLEAPDEEIRKKGRGRMRRLSWISCVFLTLGLLGLTVPMVCHAAGVMSGAVSLRSCGEALCRGLLSSGLPPVHTARFPWETETDAPYAETESTFVSDETLEPGEPETATPLPSSTEETETLSPSEPPLQSAPIVTADRSESDKGWDYLLKDPECRVPQIPETVRFSQNATLLILHSHPYEAYGDGGNTAWHNGEGWAVKLPKNGKYADDGVVALGEELTLLLRLRGVRVIHAVLPAEVSFSHMDTYDETEKMLTEILSSYPQIAWVIDLRRGAEQTADGYMLRTRGTYGDEATAQLQIWVDTRSETQTQGRDLRVALDLRAALFAEEPTLSRPVYLRRGEGLCGEGKPVMLTLEFGTAGNTFEEAKRLLVPVADAIFDILARG